MFFRASESVDASSLLTKSAPVATKSLSLLDSLNARQLNELFRTSAEASSRQLLKSVSSASKSCKDPSIEQRPSTKPSRTGANLMSVMMLESLSSNVFLGTHRLRLGSLWSPGTASNILDLLLSKEQVARICPNLQSAQVT